ncbi:ECF transporter S component [Clostridium algidicarnis]|uniref:ECF transporter S component n=1 Tax=Clostridium algidicarnis TaxID=37659 RepID=UPI001C0E8952|nr:ECF transporter S component [Clostridium algidicarnis]MBU3194193.1 ECF transporter S component [Clostridium algidicarnis]
MNKKFNLNKQIKITLLAAMAFILMYFDFPLPLFPGFLKIDLSDLPALIGAFALGPVEGIVIELLKNILHVLFKGTQTALVGEFANFIVGSVLVFISGYIYKRNKNKKGAVVGLVCGVLAMTTVASLINYFVLIPTYAKVFKLPLDTLIGMGTKLNGNIIDLKTFIIWSVVPFNLLKGILVSLVTLGVYKNVSSLVHKEEVILEKKKCSKENI